MPGVFLLSPGAVYLDPNVQSVQSNATVTTSGSQILQGFGTKEISLVINIKNAPTGTLPAITYSIQEVDPGDRVTTLGAATVGITMVGTGTQVITINTTLSGSLKVSWAVSGTTPSFTGVYATLTSKATTVLTGQDAAGVQHPLMVDSNGRQQTLLYDGQGNPVAISSDGAFQVSVTDEAVRALLVGIFDQLKLMNVHLSKVSDLDITSKDLVDD